MNIAILSYFPISLYIGCKKKKKHPNVFIVILNIDINIKIIIIIFIIIISILKSLVIFVIWLALNGVIYSQIAPFFALNPTFFQANEEAKIQL